MCTFQTSQRYSTQIPATPNPLTIPSPARDPPINSFERDKVKVQLSQEVKAKKTETANTKVGKVRGRASCACNCTRQLKLRDLCEGLYTKTKILSGTITGLIYQFSILPTVQLPNEYHFGLCHFSTNCPSSPLLLMRDGLLLTQ